MRHAFFVNCWFKHVKHLGISCLSSPTSFVAARGTQPRHPINQANTRSRTPFQIIKTKGAQKGWFARGPKHHQTANPPTQCLPSKQTGQCSFNVDPHYTFIPNKKNPPSGLRPHDRLNPFFFLATWSRSRVSTLCLTSFDVSLPRLLPLCFFLSAVDTHTNGQWIWNTGKNREVLFLLDRFFNMHGPCRGPCSMPSEKGRLF